MKVSGCATLAFYDMVEGQGVLDAVERVVG